MTVWPLVRLGEILSKSEEWVELDPLDTITQVRVQWWGQGAVARRTATAAELGSKRWLSVRRNQFLISRIDARKGAAAIVPRSLDGAFVSNDFPAFNLDTSRVEPQFLDWYSKTARFVADCEAASEGTTNRVRLKEDRFATNTIPLPPLDEQRQVVARIERLFDRISEARRFQTDVDVAASALLMSMYHRIADAAPQKLLAEVAPLNRRPVIVESAKTYPQVAVRSFGKGTFHREPLVGADVTWEKPFLVRCGDILFSNIKAWEGAIAVATESDDGFVGSHRYLTCVPLQGLAMARFVCFHLLTPDGLRHIGEASPGSADRNRTLNAKALSQIPIPVPSFEKQVWFDQQCRRVDSVREIQRRTDLEIEALKASLLSAVFRL
jgi:type I restriction enzyme S subunit